VCQSEEVIQTEVWEFNKKLSDHPLFWLHSKPKASIYFQQWGQTARLEPGLNFEAAPGHQFLAAAGRKNIATGRLVATNSVSNRRLSA